MPNRDGTGPVGSGMGRGNGWRADGWYGCRRAGGYNSNTISRSEKEWLNDEKEILETRLKNIGRQLEGLSKTEK